MKNGSADPQTIAAIARETRGNFRSIDVFFTQKQKVMKIDEHGTLTDKVTEAARSTLVIASSQLPSVSAIQGTNEVTYRRG